MDHSPGLSRYATPVSSFIVLVLVVVLVLEKRSVTLSCEGASRPSQTVPYRDGSFLRRIPWQ